MRTVGIDPENRAHAVGAALLGRSVKGVARQEQSALRPGTISAGEVAQGFEALGRQGSPPQPNRGQSESS